MWIKACQKTLPISHMGNCKQQMWWKFLDTVTRLEHPVRSFPEFFKASVIHMPDTPGYAHTEHTQIFSSIHPSYPFLPQADSNWQSIIHLLTRFLFLSLCLTVHLSVSHSVSLSSAHTHPHKDASPLTPPLQGSFSSPHNWPPDWPKVF